MPGRLHAPLREPPSCEDGALRERLDLAASVPWPASGEVHVWLVELDELAPAAFGARDREHRRSARPAAVGSSRRLRSHQALRTLLGAYLQLPPEQVALQTLAGGKPAVAGELRFNLAHSGALALYAFTTLGEVGIDVELIRRGRGGRDHRRLAAARRAFGEREAHALARLPPHELLRAWVRHEACLKLAGCGLARERPAPRGPAPWIAELALGEGTFAAMALQRPPIVVRCVRWPGRGYPWNG